MIGIGLVMSVVGFLVGPILGKMSFLLIFVGLIHIGLGASLMATKHRAVKKDVFVKCPFCRATIPIDSEKCPICAADIMSAR